MQILSTTNYSIIVLSDAGVRYEYGHFNPYQLKQLKRLLKHRAIGKAWQLLRRYPLWHKKTML